MPHYLIRATYTREGIQGVLKDGAAARLDAVARLAESVGGRLETAYWAFGEDDFIAIMELPDNVAAAAAATKAASAGTSSISTTVLLSADEMDEAIRRSPEYRAPGS